jgi:hypothetical protein
VFPPVILPGFVTKGTNMKKLSLAPATGLLALVVSPIGNAAPPAKSPPLSAYVHVVATGAGGNVCTADGKSTILNSALANGNPNAVIVVTYNTGKASSSGIIAAPSDFFVYYDDLGICGVASRWVAVNNNGAGGAFVGGERINVVVAAP